MCQLLARGKQQPSIMRQLPVCGKQKPSIICQLLAREGQKPVGQAAHLHVICAGILYHDMYASDLVGTHVEMRSLEVRAHNVYAYLIRFLSKDSHCKVVCTPA